MKNWQPPENWLRITTIDAHTGGEPFRVITGGLPQLPGDTILARRRYMKHHLDHLRTSLMWEPRGHADMFGRVQYDIAFGGAFYAYVQAASIGLTCTPQRFPALVQKGMAIKRAIMAKRNIPHPFEPEDPLKEGFILR